MMRYVYCGLLAALVLAPSAASAGLVLSVDMDPFTPGVQSTTTVTAGNIFSVDVVLADDGMAPTPQVFDTILFEISYNDAGNVLAAGPSGYVGGALAGVNPGFVVDLFGMPIPQFAATGAPLGVGFSFPTPGYAAGGGAVGLLDMTGFVIPSNNSTTVLSYDFLAVNPGSSNILAAGTPPGSPVLSFGGMAVPAQLVAGSVTVEPSNTPVPEPRSFVLAGVGALLLVLYAGLRKNRIA